MLFNRHNSKKNGTPPKNRARGAPPPSGRPPATAHYRTHRVSPAPGRPRRRAWGQRQPHTPVFPNSARFPPPPEAEENPPRVGSEASRARRVGAATCREGRAGVAGGSEEAGGAEEAAARNPNPHAFYPSTPKVITR